MTMIMSLDFFMVRQFLIKLQARIRVRHTLSVEPEEDMVRVSIDSYQSYGRNWVNDPQLY